MTDVWAKKAVEAMLKRVMSLVASEYARLISELRR